MLCSPYHCRARLRVLILALFIAVLYLSFYHNIKAFFRDPSVNVAFDLEGKSQLLESLKTQLGQTCVHPELSIWHPALAPYFKDVPPLQCDKVEENWVYTVNGTFKFSQKSVKSHGSLLCEFVPMIRGNDDYTVMNGNPIQHIQDGDFMPNDFGEIKCVGKDGTSYKNLIAGIGKMSNLKSRKRNFTDRSTELNILMVGFDSTSRMTFMRNLPKSHDYFVNELKGEVLEGYNIVGDGTPQALLPILTGCTEPELPEARRGYAGATTVDGHPWIWKRLKEMGYITQWGEDDASYGAFTYRMLGFKDQPVDHYLNTFYIRAEDQYSSHFPYCLGSLPRHVNMLNWVKDFFTVYHNKPRFSFVFHGELTHDSFSQVRVVDNDLLTFLKDLHDGGHLDNTLMILMSDHGARFQKVRETVQGKYEERMPYFGFRFPPKFAKLHPKAMRNLKTNVHRLTTPFDIHATFQDLLDFSLESKGDIANRGISVLKEIPKERSCSDAGIEAHWCACLSWQNVDLKLPNVQLAAGRLLEVINGFTSEHRSLCHKLVITNITQAVVYSPSDKVLTFYKNRDKHGREAVFSDDMKVSDILYQITIETIPGGGKFEATVKHVLKDQKFIANGHEISRINKYGNHPHCVQDRLPHLRPYCYCTVQLT